MNTLPDRREMHRAFHARDASYDGLFFVAVRSTGIFCRPSCPARRPRPENVEYHASAREALFAGFRPCLRCRPLESGTALPDWVRPVLARVEAEPGARLRDRDLRTMGVDPARVRRLFHERFGMTFQAYSRARRLGRAFDEIKEGGTLDDATLGHGFESHSGFRDAFLRRFGLPPGRAAGADYVRLAWLETPLGPMVAGACDAGVCLLEFTDRRMFEAQLATLSRRTRLPLAPGEHRHLRTLEAELAEYLAGGRTRFTVPLVHPGSEFEERVWRALQAIPHGETRSYEAIARAVGRPGAARAVGRANGLNRIAIVIPCHRVVQKDGSPGGYGGGLWRKQRLLELERGSD